MICLAALALLGVLVSYHDSVVRDSRRKATLLGHALLGVVSGPLAVLAVIVAPAALVSQKARAALVVGGFFTCLMLIIDAPAIFRANVRSRSPSLVARRR